MQAIHRQAITNSFLGFASAASNLLHIKSEENYQNTLEIIEYLFNKASDTPDDPLHDLIDILSKSVEKYESSQEDVVDFSIQSNAVNQEISVLRTLMTQHHLTVSDFNHEIGSKSLVTKILNGKKNLTKEHITKLSNRFNLNPALFFD